jgi:hypothetical protein
MSDAAAQYKRMTDALDVGNVLHPDDAAALAIALKLSLRFNIPIDRGLKWGSTWRVDVRIMDVLASLSELRTGESDRADERRIRLNPGAMRRLTEANRGKVPGERVLRGWLRELGQNYLSGSCPEGVASYDHDKQNQTRPGRGASADR